MSKIRLQGLWFSKLCVGFFFSLSMNIYISECVFVSYVVHVYDHWDEGDFSKKN